MKINNNRGVSMMTVIITIIVIIILATISLVANEDAINKSAKAKKEAEIAQETQILKIALKDAENIFTGEVEKEGLEEGLEEHSAVIDESYVSEDPAKKEYKIVFNKTGNSYIINKYGEITVLDRVYADNDTPNTPNTPSTPSTPSTPDTPDTPDTPPSTPVGSYITIADKDIVLIGDILNMEFEKNVDGFVQGMQLYSGDVFAYEGEYYIAKDSPYITNAQREQILNFSIKLNIEKGIITPSSSTVAGDIKLVGDDLYVYRPYSSNPDAWQWDSYWLKMNMNPLYEFK